MEVTAPGLMSCLGFFKEPCRSDPWFEMFFLVPFDRSEVGLQRSALPSSTWLKSWTDGGKVSAGYRRADVLSVCLRSHVF